MIIHNFDPVLVDFGLFQLRWYSVAYILGIVIGWAYAIQIIKSIANNNYKFTSIEKSDFDDLIIYLVLGIILGGRLGYIFFYNFEYYLQNISEIFMLWQGGMSFHGGLLGIVIAIAIFSNKKKISFFKITDIVACVAPIGIFLGRLANFINGELYGKISNIPWGVVFPNGGNVARHPSQIYEAVLEGIVLFVLINFFALKKKMLLKTGYVSGLFLILYSLARIFCENFREADIQIGYFLSYFSMGSLLSFVTFLIGCFLIFFINNNEKNS